MSIVGNNVIVGLNVKTRNRHHKSCCEWRWNILAIIMLNYTGQFWEHIF